MMKLLSKCIIDKWCPGEFLHLLLPHHPALAQETLWPAHVVAIQAQPDHWATPAITVIISIANINVTGMVLVIFIPHGFVTI